MRIALTHAYAWPEVRRGGERILHELASALADSGHHVRVFSCAATAGRERVLGVDTRYFRRHAHALSRWYGPLAGEVAFGAECFARLAASRIDVWHALSTTDAAAAAIVGSGRGVRSVFTDYGISEPSYRDPREDRRMYDIVLSRIDRYLCLSEAAAAPVRTHRRRTVEVVRPGVDMRRFTPGEARHPAPVLLFASDIDSPRKNLPLLLEAVAILRRRLPSVELWLTGPGDPTAVLAAAPHAAREAVTVLGNGLSTQPLVDVYGRAWATVLPAVGEAFGLVVLESLACGTPAVSLAGSAAAEIIPPGAGATCEPTAVSLAEACERALDLASSPEARERCRAAAAPHDWRGGVVPRLETIYTSRT